MIDDGNACLQHILLHTYDVGAVDIQDMEYKLMMNIYIVNRSVTRY